MPVHVNDSTAHPAPPELLKEDMLIHQLAVYPKALPHIHQPPAAAKTISRSYTATVRMWQLLPCP
eukprot:scaffold1291_cov412-Prasinococcus_capsulatus_cf.AAC.11